jgi:electron transfer flavoprotein alpha subunit
MSNLLVFVEQRGGRISAVTREILSVGFCLAKELGVELHALVLGDDGLASSSVELTDYGADQIILAEHSDLSTYLGETFSSVIVSAVKLGDYRAVMFPATAMGKDLAPRVTAMLDTAMATDVTQLEVSEGELEITRPMYGGKVFAKMRFTAFPAVISLRPNAFSPKKNSGAGRIKNIEVSLPSSEKHRVKEIETLGRKNLDVSEAHSVVSGGRGMKEPGNWRLLEDLRDALGPESALGASRAVVDAGWRPHGEQVGQTGKTVAPKLYFAVGISGAVQHLAGMRTAQTIVAINKDADAPIFSVADYGIVGDAMEILPILTEKVGQLNSEEY